MKSNLLKVKISLIIIFGFLLCLAPLLSTSNYINNNIVKTNYNNHLKQSTKPLQSADDIHDIQNQFHNISNNASSLFDSSDTENVIKKSGLSHNQQNIGTIQENGLYQNNFVFYSKSSNAKSYINNKYAVTNNSERQYGYGEGATFTDFNQTSNSDDVSSIPIYNDDVQISLPTKVKANSELTNGGFYDNHGHNRNYSFKNLTRYNDPNAHGALPFPVVDPTWYANQNNPNINANTWYNHFIALRTQLHDFIKAATTGNLNNSILTGGIANPNEENLNPKPNINDSGYYLTYFNYNFIVSDRYDQNGNIISGCKQLYCFIYASGINLNNSVQGNTNRGMSIFFHIPIKTNSTNSNDKTAADYLPNSSKTQDGSDIFSLLTTDAFGILAPSLTGNTTYIPRYSNYILSVIKNIKSFSNLNQTFYPKKDSNLNGNSTKQAPEFTADNFILYPFPIYIYSGASPSWEGSLDYNSAMEENGNDLPINRIRFNNPITSGSQLTNNYQLINNPDAVPNQSYDTFGSGWRNESIIDSKLSNPSSTKDEQSLNNSANLILQSRYLNKVAIGVDNSTSNSVSNNMNFDQLNDGTYTNPSVQLTNLPMIVDVSAGFVYTYNDEDGVPTCSSNDRLQENTSFAYPLKDPTITSSNENNGNPYVYHQAYNSVFVIAITIIGTIFGLVAIIGLSITYYRRKINNK